MKKRMISLVLAICLSTSLAIPVGASNISQTSSSTTLSNGTSVTLQEIAPGTYALEPMNSNQAGNVVSAKVVTAF